MKQTFNFIAGTRHLPMDTRILQVVYDDARGRFYGPWEGQPVRPMGEFPEALRRLSRAKNRPIRRVSLQVDGGPGRPLIIGGDLPPDCPREMVMALHFFSRPDPADFAALTDWILEHA